ncbi:uncharacterized protein LOC129884331 [Solanum dulcamara]|uniref:uncharacterized protein LOC129884331 n=1 Tax=Solanum dulcamara TaxID=45834 RepID=UPI0024868D51|nr:uncharacterized protein LOC129884331 [Solanum dulcamara]
MGSLAMVRVEERPLARDIQRLAISLVRLQILEDGGLAPTVGGYDSIWVVVDRLTKSAHFILVKVRYTADKLAQLYISYIIRLHGVPVSIVSDRGSYVLDESHVLSLDSLELSPDLIFEKEPIAILDRQIRERQFEDEKLCIIQDKVLRGEAKEAVLDSERVLRIGGRICVPKRETKEVMIDEEGVLRIKSWCSNYQQVKYEQQRPGGTIQRMPTPEWKWERIAMDFMVVLPKTLEKLAKLYILEIVRLHGVSISIISDRDRQFTSNL